MAGVDEIPRVVGAILVQMWGQTISADNDFVLGVLGKLISVELAHRKDGVYGGGGDRRRQLRPHAMVSERVREV